MPGRSIHCPGCDRGREHYAKGLCNRCYKLKFYPPGTPRRRKVLLPAMALAQLVGSRAAADMLGVSVALYRCWAIGLVVTPREVDVLIRGEVARLRRLERDGE